MLVREASGQATLRLMRPPDVVRPVPLAADTLRGVVRLA